MLIKQHCLKKQYDISMKIFKYIENKGYINNNNNHAVVVRIYESLLNCCAMRKDINEMRNIVISCNKVMGGYTPPSLYKAIFRYYNGLAAIKNKAIKKSQEFDDEMMADENENDNNNNINDDDNLLFNDSKTDENGEEKETNISVELLKQMKKEGIPMTTHICNLALQSCVFSKDVENAFYVIDIMKSVGVVPDKYTYTRLLNLYDFDKSIEVFRDMELNNVTPDVVTVNKIFKLWQDYLVERYGINGKIEDLPSELNSLLNKINNYPDDVPLKYESLLRVYSLFGQIENFMETVDKMVNIGMKPSLWTINSLIKFTKRINSRSIALDLFKLIKRLQLVPDVTTYNILLSFDNTTIDEAWVLYNDLRSNLLPTNHTFQIIANIFADHRDDNSLSLLIKDALLIRHTLDSNLCVYFINSAIKVNNKESVDLFCEIIDKRNATFGSNTVAKLVKFYIIDNRVDKAENLFLKHFEELSPVGLERCSQELSQVFKKSNPVKSNLYSSFKSKEDVKKQIDTNPTQFGFDDLTPSLA